MLSKLKKSMLKKFRKPPESLLFSIILSKIILFYKKEKKDEENENDLNFRIVNEKDENIERFNIKRLINVNCRRFFSSKVGLFTLKTMISIKFTDLNIKSSLNSFSKENEKMSSLIL